MEIKRYKMWEETPGAASYEPWLEHYIPAERKTDSAMLIIPGSAYCCDPMRPKQEGERVAKHFCEKGINVFVLRYRVFPDTFPCPVLDGRRAVRYIRYNAEKFGINKEKIAALGYSSGGHLTASLFNYFDKIEFEGIDEIDNEDFVPNYQILAYPVISMNKDNYFTHKPSPENLLADRYEELRDKLSPEISSVTPVPPTFLWHNFDDTCVNVVNTLRYAESLKNRGTSVEMHIFPDGGHGIGLPTEDTKVLNHAGGWIDLLEKWLEYQDF